MLARMLAILVFFHGMFSHFVFPRYTRCLEKNAMFAFLIILFVCVMHGFISSMFPRIFFWSNVVKKMFVELVLK